MFRYLTEEHMLTTREIVGLRHSRPKQHPQHVALAGNYYMLQSSAARRVHHTGKFAAAYGIPAHKRQQYFRCQ